jgi:hypothetical protein
LVLSGWKKRDKKTPGASVKEAPAFSFVAWVSPDVADPDNQPSPTDFKRLAKW